jgi:hypothetical protein
MELLRKAVNGFYIYALSVFALDRLFFTAYGFLRCNTTGFAGPPPCYTIGILVDVLFIGIEGVLLVIAIVKTALSFKEGATRSITKMHLALFIMALIVLFLSLFVLPRFPGYIPFGERTDCFGSVCPIY